MGYSGISPKDPTDYKGIKSGIVPAVTRSRRPTTADYRQPETGRNYPITCIWQVGKNPTTGSEGELWMLSKIVANVATWIQVSGVTPVETITGDDGTPVSPDGARNFDVVGSVVANATNAKPLFFDGTEAANTQTLELQVSTTLPSAPADKNDAGVVSLNQAHFTVTEHGFVSLIGGGLAIDSNTGDDSVEVSPDANGNFNWIGLAVANATHAKPVFFKDSSTANAIDLDVQVGAAVTGAPGDKNDAGLVSLDDENFVVNSDGFTQLIDGTNVLFVGKHGNDARDGKNFEAAKLTINAAISAASSGTVIIVYPGTYSDPITADEQVTVVGHTHELNTLITGKITVTVSGSVTFSNLLLQTNSDYIVTDTGSNSGTITFASCRLTMTDNDAVNINNSNRTLNFDRSTLSSASTDKFINFNGDSLGLVKTVQFSSAAQANNTITGTSLLVKNCNFGNFPFTLTAISSEWTHTSFNTTANVLQITTATSGGHNFLNCAIRSNTSAAISAGAGTTVRFSSGTIFSSNAFPFTGAGTLQYSGVSFIGSGSGINVSTSTGFPFKAGAITGTQVNADNLRLDGNTLSSQDTDGNVIVAANGAGILDSTAQDIHAEGISFDTGTNVLDVYEEGTFSPTVIGTSTAGTATYSVQIGNYTKIGNRVYFTINLSWSAGSGTGNLRLEGLPFTANASNGTSPCSISFGSNLVIAAGTDQVSGFVLTNTTNIGFTEINYNTAGPALAYDAASLVNVSGFYFV